MFNLFESQAEKEARRKAFEAKIFPQGNTQKDHIQSLLKEHFPNHDTTHLLYEYIVRKEKILDEEEVSYKIRIKPKLTDKDIETFKNILKEDLESDTYHTNR